MKLFITKKKLVKTLAEEIAYLQIKADWWYYCFPSDVVDKESNITKQDMSSSELELVTEVRAIAIRFDILSQVYEEAYKIYDFRNSGKKDFEPNVELIKQLNRDFCEPMGKKRPIL